MTKKQTKKLDSLWSEAVKAVAKDKCEISGVHRSDKRLNSCHIIGRRYRGTRWGSWFLNKEGREIYDLCGFCGTVYYHNQYDEHGPLEKLIKDKVIGNERFEKIRQKSELVNKAHDYDEIKKILEMTIEKKRYIYRNELPS